MHYDTGILNELHTSTQPEFQNIESCSRGEATADNTKFTDVYRRTMKN